MDEKDEKQMRRFASKKRLGFLVVAFVVAAIFLVGYFCGGTGQSVEGPNIVLVGVRGYLSEEQKEALTERFNAFAPEDTSVELRVYEFPAQGGVAQQFRDFTSEISKGNANLFLLDDYVYDLLGDETLYADLSQLYPNDPSLYQKYRCTLMQKSFWVKELSGAPKLYLLLRSKASSSRGEEMYAVDMQILDNIMAA